MAKKSDIIRAVSAQVGDLTDRKVGEVIEFVIAEIKSRMRNGEAVIINDFGKFYTKTVRAKFIHNPITGKKEFHEEHKTPVFRFAKGIIADLNGIQVGGESGTEITIKHKE